MGRSLSAIVYFLINSLVFLKSFFSTSGSVAKAFIKTLYKLTSGHMTNESTPPKG
jgi:ABC-type uncharacterized transport system permease subunit